jgi:F0F1-type ATP synthase assembly protein I
LNQDLLDHLARGLRIQSLVAISLAVLLLLVSPVAAYSSLFGSLAVFIPGLLFTVLAVSRMGADSAAFLRMAVVAEFGKLMLTGVLCAVVFVWVKPLAAGFFFMGMILTLMAGWLGLILAAQKTG